MTEPLPDRMPVAVYRGRGVVEVEQRPVPAPAPGEVLVEVSHCGVCGSDLHMMVERWGKPGFVGGHEFTGSIVAVGPDVTAWSVGDLIVCGSSPKCGRCRRCLEGKPSQCERRDGDIGRDLGDGNGAFARYTLVREASLLRLPDGVSLRDAALAEPLAVALHGITRSRIGPGDSSMIFGAGPIGALTLAVLKARSDSGPVTVVEPGAARRDLARALGADTVLTPDELDVFPLWEPERISPHAVDVVFECSGKKQAMEAGFHQLRRGGMLTMVGAGVEPPSLDPNRMILNELGVCGSFIYDADGFDRALDLLASAVLPTHLLIDGDDVPLDRLGDALTGLANGSIAGKAMVVPRLSDPDPEPGGAP